MFLHQYDEFQRIDGVESETLAEEGSLVVDVVGSHILKVQSLDDVLLEFCI